MDMTRAVRNQNLGAVCAPAPTPESGAVTYAANSLSQSAWRLLERAYAIREALDGSPHGPLPDAKPPAGGSIGDFHMAMSTVAEAEAVLSQVMDLVRR